MSDSSTFKILLTTDNHLGFAERDPRRGDDSFTTFEEVLRAARTEHDVDAMLLGGDLFHENKPSLGCLVRACSLFRKYVYGNKPVPFSLLSDPATTFPTHALPMANFQDPNVNVALPVFAIHGNHDDPVGGTSSIDLLATNGYLNYFGHVPSLEEIVLEPVLLRKGSTFIALYGLGNVRDERLHRCFRLRKVQFVYPKPVPGRRWFNILLLHQNRGVRGAASKNGIMEGMLAGFGMDLVVWGNEHEQLMVPQPADGFDVVQPGSTVMTSLSAQECNPKQYGILEVRGTSYRLTPYTLRSVRPVVRRTVELRQDLPDGRTLDAVETFLHSVMYDMISEAEEQVARIPDDVLTFHPNLKYPLIRLAVDFSDATSAPYPQPNFNRFGQQYMDVVANPGELLRPVKPKPDRRAGGGGVGAFLGPGGAAALHAAVVPTIPALNTLDIRVKVADVFNANTRNACTLLSESELSAAVYAFAEKGERDAIDERLMELLHTSQKSVWRRLENGSNDSILKPDRVVEEVATHKRHVNERYARAAQLEDAQLQRRDGEDEEDEEDDGEAAERRGAERDHGVDEVRAGAVGASTSRGWPAADGIGLGGLTAPPPASAARWADRGPRGAAAGLDGTGNARSTVWGGGDGEHGGHEEEGEGEELPDDGLDRVPIESMIAQAVHQHHDQYQRPPPLIDAPGPPSKRTRSADGEAVTVDVDDEGENGEEARRPPAARGRRAGAAASANKAPRTASRRAAGGAASPPLTSGATAAAPAGVGTSAGPTLTFVPRRTAPAAPAAASSSTAAGATNPSRSAMLKLVSKWAGSSQGQ